MLIWLMLGMGALLLWTILGFDRRVRHALRESWPLAEEYRRSVGNDEFDRKAETFMLIERADAAGELSLVDSFRLQKLTDPHWPLDRVMKGPSTIFPDRVDMTEDLKRLREVWIQTGELGITPSQLSALRKSLAGQEDIVKQDIDLKLEQLFAESAYVRKMTAKGATA